MNKEAELKQSSESRVDKENIEKDAKISQPNVELTGLERQKIENVHMKAEEKLFLHIWTSF